AQKAIANITVAVPVPVTFSTQPQSVATAVGHKATFTVAASGSGVLTYQWKKGGAVIAGATSASYTTPTLALVDSGSVYTCEVTGKAGTVASNPATLTVQALGTATTVSSTTVTAIPDATQPGGPGTAVTPGAAVEIPFTVAGVTGNVGEVTMAVYLSHTWVGDLDITLVAPDASTVTLAHAINGGNAGSAGGSALGTSCGTYATFSDLGTVSIQTQTSGNLPLTGIYIPYQALDRFNGKSPNGTWKLRIQDFGPVDTGTFNCGVLTVKPLAGQSLDLNADGTTDLRDLLYFSKFYGTTTATCDLNSDGTVNDADLALLLAGL
ncbi:MAG TPA: proprotein convertase P-domain-containing protein, partial [Geothrix sp.]|nr:proprotein convertase P-domain-containing protein [Geothrix sp.]